MRSILIQQLLNSNVKEFVYSVSKPKLPISDRPKPKSAIIENAVSALVSLSRLSTLRDRNFGGDLKKNLEVAAT